MNLSSEFGSFSNGSIDSDRAFQRVQCGGASKQSSRVCNMCIRRKVKCDQKRPSCSTCLGKGWICGYSYVKRKPGPALRSRRRPRAADAPSSNNDHVSSHPLAQSVGAMSPSSLTFLLDPSSRTTLRNTQTGRRIYLV
ncbi:hypothetical protein K469DRAFT_285697 [Zopfia rhizophila CBS 207.26]|uniref:Zn(2)-C6 fungal-type domain-containing protein n=1 Tax=Zopfia rhizophila CBS 207.26 TaxID=1314779 RepID=A0A6A6ETG3_9PEZI|nr:hypothetical protein K469DRAFT_285697 [Zopfia rhizophila CBS 207.26]